MGLRGGSAWLFVKHPLTDGPVTHVSCAQQTGWEQQGSGVQPLKGGVSLPCARRQSGPLFGPWRRSETPLRASDALQSLYVQRFFEYLFAEGEELFV